MLVPSFKNGFEKKAFVGMLAKGALGLGKKIVTNPGKALTAAYAGSELGSAMNRASQAATHQTMSGVTNVARNTF